jgi:hypothetical protein
VNRLVNFREARLPTRATILGISSPSTNYERVAHSSEHDLRLLSRLACIHAENLQTHDFASQSCFIATHSIHRKEEWLAFTISFVRVLHEHHRAGTNIPCSSDLESAPPNPLASAYLILSPEKTQTIGSIASDLPHYRFAQDNG